jgi:GNAT superfamily N-acetyltransferase
VGGDETRIFCGTELAARIERLEADLIAKANEASRLRRGHDPGFAIKIGGGVASFAEDGSPFNKVAGLGFGGVPSATALEEVERSFAARRTPVQVELSNLADPAVGARLTARGYRLLWFENVLGLAIGHDRAGVTPAGIEVRLSGEDEYGAWLDVVFEGFAHPDGQGVPSQEDFPRDVIERAERDFSAAGVVRYVALCDGVIAGGASFRIAEGVAQLAGAATAPAYRRRGIHTALLSARLADAAADGCDIAVVTTQPGSKSQQNMQRHGFDLLYTRAVLVKNPED